MGWRKFWVVVVEGNRVPQAGFFAHYTLEGAQEEATRLIRKERKPVVIMEAIMEGKLEQPLPPVKWEGLVPRDEVPFD